MYRQHIKNESYAKNHLMNISSYNITVTFVMSCLSTKVHNTASYLEMMQGNGFRSQCFWEVRYLCWITFASNADAVYSRFLKEKDNTDVRGKVSLCILHERDVIIEERMWNTEPRRTYLSCGEKIMITTHKNTQLLSKIWCLFPRQAVRT